jgi:tetratricopeptide (TPR) repeat protein
MDHSWIITRNEKDPVCEETSLFAVILYRKALEQLNKGDYESALHHLGQIVRIAPGFIMALCEIGLCYEALGQYP